MESIKILNFSQTPPTIYEKKENPTSIRFPPSEQALRRFVPISHHFELPLAPKNSHTFFRPTF